MRYQTFAYLTCALELSVCFLLAMSPAQPVFAQDDLRVGFRIDARPFSYCIGLDAERDPEKYNKRVAECKTPEGTDEPRFRGFVVDICEFVISKLGLTVERVGVDAGNRFTTLLSQDPDTGIDVLCDTTSVTAKRTPKYMFSPLVFVSGVSYAVSPSQKNVEVETYLASGRVADENTAKTTLASCSDDNFATAPVYRIGVLKGTTSKETIEKESTKAIFNLRKGERVCLVEVDGGYFDAVKKMCDDKEFSFFFGDRDMLKFYLEKYREGVTTGACDVELSRQFYSFEPYAISVDPSKPELYLSVQAKVFEFFTNPERVQSAFQRSFGADTKATPLLESLWRLNALGRL